MKKINYFFISLFTLLIGCYEDKGNYDYKDIQQIEIEAFPSINKTVGDTIRIEPEFNIDIPEDASYLSFEWSVGGETRPDDPNWNSRNFLWVADKLVSSNIVLKITDTRYRVKYMQQGYCTVAGEFDAWFSWTILAEKDGEASLAFFKTEETEWSSDYSVATITEWKEYDDLYPSRNGGQKLGRGALSMREHYCDDRSNDNVGQYWIFTQDGATDLEGVGFTKDITLNQAFMGGSIPEGVVIQGGVFMKMADIVYDQNGRLYSRVKSDPNLFNSDYFLTEPVKYDGETLEQCEPIFGRYTKYNGTHTPIIDRKNNRLLVFMDGGTYFGYDELKGAGHIFGLPEPTLDQGDKLPDNYIPLDNFEGYELIDMCYKKVTSSELPGFYALFKDATGHFYLEEFALRSYMDAVQGVYLRLSNIKVHDLGGKLTQVPSLMCVPPNGATDYVFFAIDNVLYMYDKDTGIWSEYLRFDAPITAMDGDNHYKNMLLAVGLENGKFHVVNIVNAKNRPLEERIMCTTKARFGKIIQINWKIGSKGSWT